MKRFLFLAASLVLGFGAMAQTENIKVGTSTRNMITHVPANLPYSAPLLISLHGANQDAAYQRSQTQWDLVADTAKFVVVYPNAINKFWDVNGTSDTKFIETIIDTMYQRYHINKNRVYVSGFSLGGMLTYHCMQHLGNKIAAFGPVSGVRFDNKAPVAPRRVPFIHTHGTGDDVFKWGGDLNHAAGGYPAIPDYVQKWATYEKLGVKTTISPYPSTKRNSIATLTKWKSATEGDTIEIALLALKDKGHWHSNDVASGVHTSIEIWNFCKRYTLGPAEAEPPFVVKAEPENGSFDMSSADRDFKIEFSKDVDCSNISATLGQYVLTSTDTDFGKTVTFSLPEDINLEDGEYVLTVKNIKSKDGGTLKSITMNYTYGIADVDASMKIDTLLYPRWYDEQAKVGEGIPMGWKRVNSNADGKNDTKESGAANTGGVRLKYFEKGGDIDAGFYFSAREYQQSLLTYGSYNAYPLHFKPGKYELTMNSAFWNSGARDGDVRFNAYITKKGKTTQVFSANSLPSASCLDESTDRKVENSQAHKLSFTISEEADYTLNFTTSAGWSGLILGNILITTERKAAYVYKGGLLRALEKANALYRATEGMDVDESLRERLKACIDEYSSFSSISPSAYTAAIKEVEQAMPAALQDAVVGIKAARTASNAERKYYDMSGRMAVPSAKGIYLSNGKKYLMK